MLTKEELDFIAYWDTHREKENTLKTKMLRGGPWGLIFALPILIMALFHEWYKRMIPITKWQMIGICVCVAAIAVFYAYFRQQVRWERNEQLYQELKFKEKKSAKTE